MRVIRGIRTLQRHSKARREIKRISFMADCRHHSQNQIPPQALRDQAREEKRVRAFGGKLDEITSKSQSKVEKERLLARSHAGQLSQSLFRSHSLAGTKSRFGSACQSRKEEDSGTKAADQLPHSLSRSHSLAARRRCSGWTCQH